MDLKYHLNQQVNSYDYEYNELGQALNDNAMLSDSKLYRDLFQPDTAALNLLNIDADEVEVSWGYLDGGTEDAFVQFLFSDTNDTITVRMIQPYGSAGIWIPKNPESE